MQPTLAPTRMSYTGSALVVVDYYTRPGNTQAGNFADLFIDNSGNFYATYCSGDQRAFKLTLAGNTWSSTNIIAPGTYNCPVGITVLPNGDIYLGIQDNDQNPSVFKIPAGTSLPTANSGSGFQGLFSGIGCPGTFAFDPTYSTMYVSCGCASKIYTVDMGTLAVTSTSAQEFNVYGIATDAEGAIYVAATTSGVYKIANPKVSMVPVRLANINTPQNNIYIIGVCVDKVANILYAVDNNYNNIYKVNPTTGDYVLLATWTGRHSARCVVDKDGYVYIASNTDGYIGRLERLLPDLPQINAMNALRDSFNSQGAWNWGAPGGADFSCSAAWQGVTCNSLGKVARIQAVDGYQGGTLPTSIGQLTALTTLYVFRNNLVGTIPTQMGLLTNMVIMEISYNSLTGTIPSQLGNLHSMTQFSVSVNSLSGTLPCSLGDAPIAYAEFFSNNFQSQVCNNWCKIRSANFVQWSPSFTGC